MYIEGWGRRQREKVNQWFIYLDLYKGREIKGYCFWNGKLTKLDKKINTAVPPKRERERKVSKTPVYHKLLINQTSCYLIQLSLKY